MVGLKLALALGAAVALTLAFFQPNLALGVLGGLAALALARGVYARLLGIALRDGKRQALLAAALGKFGLLAALSLMGVALGADPLGVVLGLALFPLGLWLSLGFYVLRNR